MEEGKRQRLIERAAEALDLAELPSPESAHKDATQRLEKTQTEPDFAEAAVLGPEDAATHAAAPKIEVRPQQPDAAPRQARRTLPWMRARAKARGKP